jgi:hypothetical protein
MEKSKDKLFINGVKVYLENIEYKSTDINNIQIKISQNLDLVSCNKDMIIIRMTRRIMSDKTDDFKLIVSSIGEFHLEERSMNNFKNLDEMEKYANERMGYIIDKVQMGSVMSQIIANVTGTFGRPPIILPAVINEDTFKKD